MAQKSQGRDRFTMALAGIAIVVVLYFAREVLVPIALAVFVAFVLAPIVRMLERWKFPRIVAVAMTVGIATVSLGGLGWLVEQQAAEVATNLHDYRANVIRKLSILRPSKQSALSKAGSAIEELGKEIAKPVEPTAEEVASAPPAEPVTVRLVEAPTPPITYLRDMLGPMLARLATGVMVVVFAIFMLLRREDLRNRLIRLIGEREMHITTPAIDDAARRLSRYLLTQSAVNAGVGTVVGLGLFLIGMPNAALWGFIIAILRFVPYVGTWLGAAFPIVLSIAVTEGWREPLLVAGIVIGAEVIGGSFVEPLLVGSGTGLSPLAVLTSAVFWAWLWGPIGLVLSTPIAVVLSVVGRHVRSLSFLNVLLGDEPVLTPEARFYQRLLAGDQEESMRIVEEFAKGMDSVEVDDSLLIPALRLAEFDRHRGELDEQQEQAVREILGAIIEDQWSRAEPGALTEAVGVMPVLCVPARDAADELTAKMLEKALAERGIASESLSAGGSPREVAERFAKLPEAVICVCALPPNALLHTRSLWRELRARCPRHRILICLWDDSLDEKSVRERIGRIPAEALTRSLKQAAEALESVVREGGGTKPEAEEKPVQHKEEGSGRIGAKKAARHERVPGS